MTSASAPATEAIPERSSLPFIGHALSIPSGVDGMLHLMAEAKEIGPLFKLRIFGSETTIVAGLDLVTELSDETRFCKNVHPDLVCLRPIGGDGLFTAFNDEPNWSKAHDILMPAFSLSAMRGYHSTMLQVARGLIAKWDRANDQSVDVTADMTRLTFDTIGLCGFGHDFDSFGRDEPHPFIEAMTRALAFAQATGESLPGADLFRWKQARRFDEDVMLMNNLVDDVIKHRKTLGDNSMGDLLGRMLHTPDARTGEPLDDVNIRHQVLTFLIAGHETTSGALSFALYYLTKHPAALARARAEVDNLWGDVADPDPRYDDIGKLIYIRQVLNESLRLWPTAPSYAVEPREDTVIGGKYAVRKGETLMVLIPALHRDSAWGDNVELFDPDRFARQREDERPAHLFKPFGTGERACIGRQFALHEATLLLGLLVHRYRLIDDTDYQLKIKQTLTIKPDGFTLRLGRRSNGERALPAGVERAASVRPQVTGRRVAETALTVLHGSNLGNCAGIARALAADGDEYGFTTTVAPLNDAVGKLTADSGAVVIVAASYNGRPTDDAAEFVDWLEHLPPGSLDGVRYAVLGVGDRNWAATYQHIPILIDERLTAAGASPLLHRGAADAAADLAAAIDAWTGELWSALLERYGAVTGLESEPVEERDPGQGLYELVNASDSVTGQLAARHGVRPMDVLEARELVDTAHPLGRSKRFLKLRLPVDVDYRTGDHLAILPRNPDPLVERVADRFSLDLDRTIRLRTRRPSRNALPVDRPLTVRHLLTDFVELQDPATQQHVAILAAHTACPPERRPLADLASAPPAAFDQQVTQPRRSVLDLLEQHRACGLPFDEFLEMLPVLRPRHYSISSSAAATRGEVDIMVSLLAAPHRSGDGVFSGIASHYLQTVEAGDSIQARVLPCRDAFRPPSDTSVPVITVSAGTGLAPFRGAILDRLHHRARGKLLCYFGCDAPNVDYLHRAELEAAQAAGVVDLRPAFMHAPQDGIQFVQDRIEKEADEVWAVLQANGRVYVCGDGRRMAPAVRDAFIAVYRAHSDAGAEEGAAWLDALIESERYVEDVWAG